MTKPQIEALLALARCESTNHDTVKFLCPVCGQWSSDGRFDTADKLAGHLKWTHSWPAASAYEAANRDKERVVEVAADLYAHMDPEEFEAAAEECLNREGDHEFENPRPKRSGVDPVGIALLAIFGAAAFKFFASQSGSK